MTATAHSLTQDRLVVLSGASRSFAEATTDYPQLLTTIVQRLAEALGDYVTIRLFDDSDPDALIEVASFDPEASPLVAELRAKHPVRYSQTALIKEALEGQSSVLIEDVERAARQGRLGAEHLGALQALSVRSLIVLPLQVQGRGIGVIIVARRNPVLGGFDARDQALADALGDHAALAISNARLYAQAQAQLLERQRVERALQVSEDRLRHAYKMEAVGRLAGAVAHDFNNLLSVVLSYSALLLEDLLPNDPKRKDVQAIHTAGQRATELTRQLLAFSRKQVLNPQVLDLPAALTGLSGMLQRLLGEGVELVLALAPEAYPVFVDSGQFQQVVMNLALNARDAMPQGGRLTFRLENVSLGPQAVVLEPLAVPGPYVCLSVEDTGLGMDTETLGLMFEPFFTTKAAGKGTGLGLATVLGIVQQSGGLVRVESEPAQGSCFRIYLPKTDRTPEATIAAPVAEGARGQETILLVEDDEAVREVVQGILRRQGYRVLEARDGIEALQLCARHPFPIQLLLTDVVMPEMNGRQLAERVHAARPETKVLYMSGYVGAALGPEGIIEAGIAFLPKPILPDRLLVQVRKVLDESARAKG